jgi:hypothetical protein
MALSENEYFLKEYLDHKMQNGTTGKHSLRASQWTAINGLGWFYILLKKTLTKVAIKFKNLFSLRENLFSFREHDRFPNLGQRKRSEWLIEMTEIKTPMQQWSNWPGHPQALVSFSFVYHYCQEVHYEKWKRWPVVWSGRLVQVSTRKGQWQIGPDTSAATVINLA